MANFTTAPAQILAGDTLSTVVECDGDLAAVIFPDAWNGGSVSFQASWDNIDYVDVVYPDGDQAIATVVPGAAILIKPDLTRAVRWLRIKAGNAQDETRMFQAVLAKGNPVAIEAPAAATASRETPRKTALPRRKHRR